MAVDVSFGLAEKFEEYFGYRLTRAMLLIVSVAVAGVCMGIIWEWLVIPLLHFFRTPFSWQTIGALVWVSVTIGVGVCAGVWAVDAMRQWQHARRLARIVNKAEGQARTLVNNARQATDEARSIHQEAQATFEEARCLRNLSAEAAELSLETARRVIAASDQLPQTDRAELNGRIESITQEVARTKELLDERLSKTSDHRPAPPRRF